MDCLCLFEQLVFLPVVCVLCFIKEKDTHFAWVFLVQIVETSIKRDACCLFLTLESRNIVCINELLTDCLNTLSGMSDLDRFSASLAASNLRLIDFCGSALCRAVWIQPRMFVHTESHLTLLEIYQKATAI